MSQENWNKVAYIQKYELKSCVRRRFFLNIKT